MKLEYRPPEPLPLEIVEYCAWLAARPAIAWVNEMYRRHHKWPLEGVS